MQSIVVVSPQVDKWNAFTAELKGKSKMELHEARSGAEAIAAVQERRPVAVVIDQNLGDTAGMDLVVQLLQIDAMINVALVSDQSEEVFHEETEGLGILMKLPPIPDGRAALEFFGRLSGVI